MAKNKIIIIVDDDEDMVKLLTFILESAGFSVEAFFSGKEALRYLVEQEKVRLTDLLILDRMLPDMDGLDILRAISKKFSSYCPVLFLTVLSTEKDVLQGLREGAIEYVTKPFSPDVLLEKVQSLVRK